MTSCRPSLIDTGLRYLVLPVTSQALTKARIEQDIGGLVRRKGAQFAVLIDVAGREMRHWNNDGKLEDIATGSAAAVVGSYLVASGAAQADETILLAQGRFLGRPSTLAVRTQSLNGAVIRAHVGGNVHLIGEGRLVVLP
jgi:predicted PhzF superfamily epimerase YddE/YHI9